MDLDEAERCEEGLVGDHKKRKSEGDDDGSSVGSAASTALAGLNLADLTRARGPHEGSLSIFLFHSFSLFLPESLLISRMLQFARARQACPKG